MQLFLHVPRIFKNQFVQIGNKNAYDNSGDNT